MKEDCIVEYTIIAFTSIIAIILTGAIFELYLHWSCAPNSLPDKDELNRPSLDALEGNERIHTWIHHVDTVQIEMGNKSE